MKQIKIDIVLYKHPEDILLAYKGIDYETEKFDDHKRKHITGNKTSWRTTLGKLLKIIQEQNHWGFAQNKDTLHLWISKECDKESIIGLMGHELGHLMHPFYDSAREEDKADQYGKISMTAFNLLPVINRFHRNYTRIKKPIQYWQTKLSIMEDEKNEKINAPSDTDHCKCSDCKSVSCPNKA